VNNHAGLKNHGKSHLEETLMKTLRFSLLAASILLLSTTIAHSAVTIKLGHGTPTTSTLHQGAEKFKSEVEKRSGGSIKVDIYHSGQIGHDRQLIESMQLGEVDMAIPSTTNVAPFVKEMFITDYFFLFRNAQEAYTILDGPAGQALDKAVTKKALVGLGFMENGFRHISNNLHPIRVPADTKGVKIRIAENPIQVTAWKGIGASPTPMNWGEIFTSLQQGTLDGQECSLSLFYDTHFFEAQKYLSLTGHIYSPFSVLMSAETFQKLDDAQKQAVRESAKVAISFQRELNQAAEKIALKKVQEGGIKVTTLTVEEMQPFVKATQPAIPMVKEKSGDEIFNLFMSEIEDYRSKNKSEVKFL
jgi:tripartite ATP-independent transporter DctP family solute receptor